MSEAEDLAEGDSAEKLSESNSNKEESGWGAWMIRKITNNIAIHVNNLQIHLQHKSTLSCLTVGNIELNSASHLWQEAFVDPSKFNFLRKSCNISSVRFTMDECDADGNITKIRGASPLLKLKSWQFQSSHTPFLVL